MSGELAFGGRLARRLRPGIPKKYEVGTGVSLLYAISFNDEGNLNLGQNDDGEPMRGGGTGFQQDLLIFERAKNADTGIIPRVSVELKFSSVTTHDSIVYSEKARRIRAIYPFVRYGLVLGDMSRIPARTLRLGTEFDFIVAVPGRISARALERLVKLLRLELTLSTRMTAVLRGDDAISVLHRHLKHSAKL